ncbi:MAG TPA: flagellar type III secretion system pore protein FliP [Phycisphaerae bacterium]|nr:flagellar type III secretion system pore protein FliP [Phycisphaerae bacterium]HQL54797.1 flagellar type III secretion system pore protein FliP [Phycisphaerae bacterium]
MVRRAGHPKYAVRPDRGVALLALLLVLARGAMPATGQDAPRGRGATEAELVGPPATATETAHARDPLFVPDLDRWLPKATNREALSNSLQILVLLTLLTVAPSLLLMMTCFMRMLVVLALLRQALGTQQLPPSQVMVGLALFLTILVMAPTWDRINQHAVQPYLNEQLDQLDAVAIAGGELRGFMFNQIKNAGNAQDVYLMYEYAAKRTVAADEVLDEAAVPMTALVPAFILSELKVAFILGFRIYLPFLVIDMVIATILVSMGMMMLPPVLISLPFKLLLFVLADGWHLVVGSLMASVS